MSHFDVVDACDQVLVYLDKPLELGAKLHEAMTAAYTAGAEVMRERCAQMTELRCLDMSAMSRGDIEVKDLPLKGDDLTSISKVLRALPLLVSDDALKILWAGAPKREEHGERSREQ